MKAATRIRPAIEADAPAITRIYGYHVLHGSATFDTVPPDEAFWRDKISAIVGKGWPFVVVEDNGIVVGYAYATQFRDRAAYARTCEDSIYVAPDRVGTGVGYPLLSALMQAARDAGFEQMIGVVGGGEAASVAVHKKCGFVEAGRMREVGYKFGKRLDTVYLQRDLRR